MIMCLKKGKSLLTGKSSNTKLVCNTGTGKFLSKAEPTLLRLAMARGRSLERDV